MFRLCKGVFNSCPFLVLGAIPEQLSNTKVFICHQCEGIQVLGFPAQLSWAFQRWYNKRLQSLLGITNPSFSVMEMTFNGTQQCSHWEREGGWNVWISMGIVSNISVWFCMPVWVYADDSSKVISLCAPLYCQNIWCISRFRGHKAKSYISFRL